MVKSKKDLIPVTVLSGFLGSGKTTLLQHLLTNREGLRIGMIVNDMSEVNVDANLIAEGQADLIRLVGNSDTTNIPNSAIGDEATTEGKTADLVELSNGCICCTLREDLLSVMINLAKEGKFDYIVIESSGISEPMPVAETFTFQDMETKESLSDFARLDTMVTVVDAYNWMKDYLSSQTLTDRSMGVNADDTRGVVDLLIDQVEFANVIVVNKCDLVSREELNNLKAVIQKLNPDAKIIESIRSVVELKEVLNTNKFSMDKAQSAPGWLKELRGEHVPESLEYGISSFVYRALKPFHPTRLLNTISNSTNPSSALGRVIRSKGHFWLATDGGMDEAAMWAQAGRIFQFTAGRPWWVTLEKSEIPRHMRALVSRMININPDGYGDRSTEIVFIGKDMNRAEVEKELNDCLLTDEEYALGNEAWDEYEDPFDFYEYEDEDEDEEEEEVPNLLESCEKEGASKIDAPNESVHIVTSSNHVHGPDCSHGKSTFERRTEQDSKMVGILKGADVRDINGDGPKTCRIIVS